jgi:predicted PurR-regulated permease PerM
MLRTIAKTTLVVATLAVLYLLYLLRGLVLTVFVAVIVATALRPAVGWVQRRLRLTPSGAALAIYGLIALALVAGTATLVPSVVADGVTLMARAPEIYGGWYELAMGLRASAHAALRIEIPRPPPQAQVTAWAVDAASQFQRSLPNLAWRTGGLLTNLLIGLVLAYYWAEARDGLVAFGLEVVSPAHHNRFLSVVDDVERVLGGFVAGQLMLSLLIGLVSLLAFVIIGLPDPLLLAFISGLFHVVPLIGAAVGAVPAVLVAISLSPAKGLATGLALLLIHQVENSLIAPRVLQRQVGLSSLLVIVALMAGAALDGALGAVIAVPAAGALWILMRDLLIEPVTRRLRAEEYSGPTQTPDPVEGLAAGSMLEPVARTDAIQADSVAPDGEGYQAMGGPDGPAPV